MLAAYKSGDPYLAFAKQAGAVPQDATKQSHSAQRDLFKACVLAVQYGMGPDALAARIGQPPVVARICCVSIRKPTAHSGAGRTLPLTTPCPRARCIRSSGGPSTSEPSPTRDPCVI